MEGGVWSPTDVISDERGDADIVIASPAGGQQVRDRVITIDLDAPAQPEGHDSALA